MFFLQEGNVLIGKREGETLRIEPWGQNALRVRSTMYPEFTGNDWGLEEEIDHGTAQIETAEGHAKITNGNISADINNSGVITFYKNGVKILQEYYHNYDPSVTKESICLKLVARNFKPIVGGDYKLTMRFEPNDDEKIFGMGCYQQKYMDLKGCVLELAQRNSQTSIPFALSSKGFGFLWNNPAVGKASFGKNYTEFEAYATKELDYWIVAEDTPAKIVERYTEVTGRAPVIRNDVFGLWQSRLRYRTQEEVLSVARKYKELGIKLDVIVIDFFHWTRQGDWQFDPEYWPDPKSMIDELHAGGTKVIVSVWPSVDKKSIHFNEMWDKGYLIRTEHGSNQTYDYQGDCVEIDCTNPEARQYIWDICKKNYYDYGIDMFWLDNAEPDFGVYDFDNYRYRMGTALSCSNIYPKLYAKAFFDGQKADGNDKIFSLIRCGWVGSQKYGTLLWNGDIQSTLGPKLLEECMTLNGCKTGQAKITGGYNLPAKFVIHTVGPIYFEHTPAEAEQLLASCYKNSLSVAKENNLRTIAFPLISAGVYGYPQREAIKVAVQNMKLYQEDFDSMTLVLFGEKEFNFAKADFPEFCEA